MLRVTYLRRPHWSARNADVKQLQAKPTVPYTPARQRIVFEFIPRDLYKIAAQKSQLDVVSKETHSYFGNTK